MTPKPVKTRVREPWSYRGLDIWPADLNSSGIHWYARSPWGILRADTKESMRGLISETMAQQNTKGN